jgi:hypothetical protein
MPMIPPAVAATVATYSAIAATAASVGAAGLSFYGQQQQAAASQRMAQYNFSVQKAQMEMQNQMAAQASQQQAAIFGYNAQVAQNEANRTEMEARERARRMRSENERMLGLQRAAYGKSGVTSEGSPLMIMADTAGLGELAVADELYKADAQRSGLFTQAALEQYKGRMAQFEGAGYSLNAANAGTFARPALMQGMNEASALRTSSYGSLISGVGSAANSLSGLPIRGRSR